MKSCTPPCCERGIAALIAAGLLLASTGTGKALASPATGYTVSYTPAGTGSSLSVAVNPATDTVYLGNQTGQLMAIDGSSNSIVTTLTLPGPVTGIAVDSATHTVYAVVSGSTPEVAVVDGATDSVSTSIPVPAGVTPEGGIAVDSSTDQIYVTDQALNSGGSAAGGGVFVIDGTSNSVVSSFSSGGGDPISAAIDESTHVLWVADLVGPIAEINDATGSLLNSLPVSGEPVSVAINPVTDTVYAGVRAAGQGAGGLIVIDGLSRTITTTLPVPSYGVTVDPAADVIYATNAAGIYYDTTVIDGATNSVEETVARGGVRVAANAATGLVYETTPPATAARIHPGFWTITPSATDGLSPVIPATSASATFTTGLAASYAITASALPAATFTETGAMPAGVTLSPSGTLSGTPAPGTGGVYTFTVIASNGIPSDYAQPFTLTVLQPAQVIAPPPETFKVGTAVSVPLQITGYPAPQVHASSPLPAGLNVVQNPPGQWELTGTPAVGSGGVYTGTFYATNTYASSVVGQSTAPYSMTVDEAPTITSAPTATFGVSSFNNFSVTATGYPDTPAVTVSGSLPAGVAFLSSGEFYGNPPAGSEGVYHLTITATNSLGTTTQAFTLDVAAPFGRVAGGVLGDVTGDGLADILAIDPAGHLWLYPNTGGDAAMFADGRSQVGQGWAGYSLAAVAPLHGSARAGILAIDRAGHLWYYPNTGGSGLGTFGTRSQVGTGWTGYTVVGLTDLYGTGRPGILAIDPTGHLWYYPNTGGSGLGTFGTRSQVGTGWTGYTADVADVNFDGKPDLLAVDAAGAGTLLLYPNAGGTGMSTFGAPTQVSSGWRGYQAVDVGQLTGSGPASMLAVDPEGELWFYPNAGGGTFGAPVQVGTGWSGFTIN